ncbi:MAG: CPBP family intramembrane metalloprotease [Lachnospiraceae bacterium]|nr:CPBP family intramembrane metalloprotease [Lachnospiraceae bacterium]
MSRNLMMAGQILLAGIIYYLFFAADHGPFRVETLLDRYYISRRVSRPVLKQWAGILILMFFFGAAIQISFSTVLTFILSADEAAASSYDQAIAPLISMEPDMVLYVGLLAPVFEELCFRGLAFSFLSWILLQIVRISDRGRSKLSPDHFLFFSAWIIANLFQTLFFALYHENIYQRIYAFVIGYFFGILVLVYRSVVPGMMAHIFVNLSGFFIDVIFPPDLPKGTKLILMTAGILTVSGILFKLCRRQSLRSA